jgi:hypothetical protein
MNAAAMNGGVGPSYARTKCRPGRFWQLKVATRGDRPAKVQANHCDRDKQ